MSYWRFHVCEFQKWNFRFWWNVKIIPRFPNDLFHVFHVGLLNHASSHIFFKEALLDLLFRKTWSKKFKTYQAKLQVATLACSSSTGHLRSNTNQSPKTRGQSKFTQWKPTQVTVIATCLLTVLISELLKVFVALGLFETILNAFVLWVADCTNTYSLVFSFGGWDAEFVYYLALNSRFLCLTSAARQCVCLLTNLAFILYGSLLYTLHF